MHTRHRLAALATLTALALAPKPSLTETPAEGRSWHLPGGPVLRAQPGAKLRVLHQPQEVEIRPGRRSPVYTVLVKGGGIDVEVPRGSHSAVALAGPRRMTVLVRSGRAGLRADGDQVSLANIDGDVLVGHDTRHFKALARGVIHHFEQHGVVHGALLDPPTGLTGQRVFISTGEPVALEKFSWSALDGAKGYRVELLGAEQQSQLMRVETRQPFLPRQPLRLEPGRYELFVKALDAFGFESARALESTLQVVQARLPLGAYVDGSGDIRLAPGSRVDFTHMQDLEMSYGRFSRERVPASVGLIGVEPLTVFLHSAHSDPLSLRLAPRTVRARVAITPVRATWPADPLTIEIELEDPSGQPPPQWLEVRPRVLLGVDALDIPFERRGRALSGIVPPQPGRGPWVVRVEVDDQFAVPLGRAFLEIARTPG